MFWSARRARRGGLHVLAGARRGAGALRGPLLLAVPRTGRRQGQHHPRHRRREWVTNSFVYLTVEVRVLVSIRMRPLLGNASRMCSFRTLLELYVCILGSKRIKMHTRGSRLCTHQRRFRQMWMRPQFSPISLCHFHMIDFFYDKIPFYLFVKYY